MFDLTSRTTYKHLTEWWKSVVRVTGEIPVVVVGTKVDLVAKRAISPEEITFPTKYSLPYVEISTKCDNAFDAPFVLLAQKLLGYVLSIEFYVILRLFLDT